MTRSDLGRRKEEEETLTPNCWACTPGRMLLFQKHLQQLQHREGFSHGNSPKTYVSAARESKTIQNPCVPCKDPDGSPSAQGMSGTDQDNCKKCFSLLVLQRERQEVCQHPTPAWSSCGGVRGRRSDPENEITLSQLDKLSLLSQGIHRLVGQGTGTEVPVNMNG